MTFFITSMPSVGTLKQLSGSAVVPGLNIASRNPVTGGRQLLSTFRRSRAALVWLSIPSNSASAIRKGSFRACQRQ